LRVESHNGIILQLYIIMI